MTKLRKKNGHLVSQKDNRLVYPQENYPKEANDVHFEYSTLFPFSTSLYCQTNRLDPCRESLDPSGPRQTIPPHLSYLRQPRGSGPQPTETVEPRLELCLGSGLDPVPVPKDYLSSLSTNAHRRPRTLRSLPSRHQKTGLLHLRTLQAHDGPRGGSTSGAGLENGQSHRPTFLGERLWSNRLPKPSHPGYRRNLHPQGAPLSDGGIGLPDRTGGLGRQRPPSPHVEEVLCQHEQRAKTSLGSHRDGYVGPLYPGCPTESPSCQNRLRLVSCGGPIQPRHRQSAKHRIPKSLQNQQKRLKRNQIPAPEKPVPCPTPQRPKTSRGTLKTEQSDSHHPDSQKKTQTHLDLSIPDLGRQ